MTPVTAAPAEEELRRRCGAVYAWNCAGELYGIECELCAERPLCALDEFAEHMELWHPDWQQPPVDELMLEVLAEQSSGGEVNELKQQLVQELNALDTSHAPQMPETCQQLNDNIKFDGNAALPAVEAPKLSTQHVQHLIELYEAQPRLWDQSHPEFRDVDRGRESWRQITDAWSAYCGRRFTVTDVRIRISTLCQRFLKQRDRIAAEGELEESIKFVHYDQLRFLCAQQSLLKRQEHYSRENRKLLEFYEHYPILWHNAHKRLRCAETLRERHEAHRGLQLALRMCGIRMSGLAMQRRLQSLRKRYRLEKIRFLHSVVEGKQAEFVPGFEHYAEMEFLHKHIDPYVCAGCGKIFENLVGHRAHVESSCEQQESKLGREREREPVEERQLGVEQAQQTEATVGELMARMENGMDEEQVQEQEQGQQLQLEVEPEQVQQLGVEQEQLEMEQEQVQQVEQQLEMEQQLDVESEQVQQLGVEQEQLEMEQEQLGMEQKQLGMEQEQLEMKREQLEMEQEQLGVEQEQLELEQEQVEQQATEPTVGELLTLMQMEQPQLEEEQELEEHDEEEQEEEESASEEPLTELSSNSEHSSNRPLRTRLSLELTHRLIELYQAQPNLWDPNHLDYNGRRQRRQSWHTIAAQLNAGQAGVARFSWQSLHRKLTDYIKYYRREREREALAEVGAGEGTRWGFYEAFSFLDDVVPINSVLQKSLQQRDSNLKIIQIYQSYEQLWCTDHPDYTKRKQRLRQLESLCTRLQEECNLQISVERLKSRLIEFRCQYRQCKSSRLAAVKRGDLSWQPDYEYYRPLQFLELHVSPFGCGQCPASFKRRSDFLRHQRNVHQVAEKQLRRRRGQSSSTNPVEHICHICAMKFSLRTSLQAHLRRHLGQRTHACSDCPKMFFNSTSLRVHQRSHTKELPYVCEHCARGFVNASKLNQHVKRHTEQRDYPCSRCEKAFYTAHERDRHLRAHLNIRDKVCPYCGRAFVVGSAYYAHLNLHRGEKRYGCANCGTRFAQYAGLYKHRKRCHASEGAK